MGYKGQRTPSAASVAGNRPGQRTGPQQWGPDNFQPDKLKMKPKTLQELFTSEETWTKGAAARTAQGDRVCWDNSRAVKWCLVGGLCLVYGAWDQPAHKDAAQKLNEVIGTLGIVMFNESASFTEMSKMIEKANV